MAAGLSGSGGYMKLDMDFVRAQFPALSGEWVFMDNAGGSQTDSEISFNALRKP